jgi:hypothetical protein
MCVPSFGQLASLSASLQKAHILLLSLPQALTITDPNEAWHFHILPDG